MADSLLAGKAGTEWDDTGHGLGIGSAGCGYGSAVHAGDPLIAVLHGFYHRRILGKNHRIIILYQLCLQTAALCLFRYGLHDFPDGDTARIA